MTEEQATYEVKPKKPMGRPKKEIKGEKLWIPAECIAFVKSYLELTKQKAKESVSHDNA
jgi:hypothetical protein